MEDRYYYSVSINFIDRLDLKEVVMAKAVDDYFCQGIEDFSMNEEQVDEALGEKAFSGGSVPQDVLDEVDLNQAAREGQRVKFYFHEGEIENNVDNFQKYLRKNCEHLDVEVEKNNWKDWNAEWKKSYKPIEISSRLTIIPEWEKEEWAGKKEALFIYPGMGFGTGDHETTFLCLQIFDELNQKQNNKFAHCLDFGCGSGILGMSALKLSPMKVDFCDIEIEALNNCKQNLELNFLPDQLDGQRLVSRERFVVKKDYDLIFANILEHILIEEKELLKECLNDNGALIISGILIEQMKKIKDEFSEMGFQLKEEKIKGQWAALLFEKK
ncbi:50S ribosomal protein L11 methyltransferase [Bacteriovoracales bacterium]|nr:50S ribosomal protein L11 methyltransferase [Bacteriovoracales bacterium]